MRLARRQAVAAYLRNLRFDEDSLKERLHAWVAKEGA